MQVIQRCLILNSLLVHSQVIHMYSFDGICNSIHAPNSIPKNNCNYTNMKQGIMFLL